MFIVGSEGFGLASAATGTTDEEDSDFFGTRRIVCLAIATVGTSLSVSSVVLTLSSEGLGVSLIV